MKTILNLSIGTFAFFFLVLTAATADADYPSLWDSFDPRLQNALEIALKQEFKGEYSKTVQNKKASMVVVDITDLKNPKVAALNPDEMMYAASMPKIAILLGVFAEVERGNLKMTPELKESLTRMIRKSSNAEATANLERVGFENLAEILQSDRYKLYDREHNGGLWIGRNYSGGPVWKRDPLHGLSHGATAMQAARWYYLAVTHRLVPDAYFNDLRDIMSKPGIEHKFVKGLKQENPDARVFRKSGTWRDFHADSGVVVDDESGYAYIIVAIAEHPHGADGLLRLAEAVDRAVKSLHEE